MYYIIPMKKGSKKRSGSKTSAPLRNMVLSLLESEGESLKRLYADADRVRKDHVGDEVYIRGIVEFSNVCANDCFYCGIRTSNHRVNRYVMASDEIISAARSMEPMGQTTIVLQSGETPGLRDDEIGRLIWRIKAETSLAITLSVGNRPYETYSYWKDYLLYPGKPCVDESSDQCASCVVTRIEALERKVGRGPGHSMMLPEHTRTQYTRLI
ncbi:MAG: 2-iminoacetate synthase [Syntrophorhabdus sp. PtaU1.Bin050]|nr:MAG: 2-iminoacetate synthase [Syntrophorhabdus sp. PtaU1.Bin050]